MNEVILGYSIIISNKLIREKTFQNFEIKLYIKMHFMFGLVILFFWNYDDL